MTDAEKFSDLDGPRDAPEERGDGMALLRLFDRLGDDDQQELLCYAVNLARKPRAL